MAGLSAVCKPIRTAIKKVWVKFFGQSSSDKILTEIKNIRVELKDVSDKCNEVSRKNDQNELDRLRDVLFRYGNLARAGNKITSEEFRYIQRVFQKYTSMGGNDIAHEEYMFIQEYYNHKRWTRR